MNILSVDLAWKRYQDFGIAFLEADSRLPQFPTPEEIGLIEDPNPVDCAKALEKFCQASEISVLLLDGPQGWRSPSSPIEHMRLCERVFNTPGRTGNPGQVKPRTYLPYIQFSIDLFQQLRNTHGWSLLHQGWLKEKASRWVVETFPSAAWDLLGLSRLPSKGKARRGDLDEMTQELSRVTGYKLPKLNHDQLQAAVTLPVGTAIARREGKKVLLAGFDPIVTPEDLVLEGWIAVPSLVDRG